MAEKEKRSSTSTSLPEWLVPWWGKLLIAVCIGSALAIIPSLMIEADAGLAIVLGILLIPGGLVGMIFSGGNLHDVNNVVVGVGNFLFYTAVVYFALWVWADVSRQTEQ